MDRVTFDDGSGKRTVIGKPLVVEGESLMLKADDGRIWTVLSEHLIDRKTDDSEFTPIDDSVMQSRVMAELPDGFSVYRTSHYLVFYDGNELYAKRVAALFEQLYRSFFSFWKNQRWKLPEPEFPLVALVLKDASSFQAYAGNEIGATANDVIGYYHMGTNRMTTFRMPDLERNMSTIIHEATHQLAYNCGMQTRFADNPLWLSEGLAMFFESPDRRNPSRWRGIGQVNQVNLKRWRSYEASRPAESLSNLMADDERFRNGSSASAAYGEAWALTYFLIKTRRQQYVKYLRTLSEGKPLAKRTKLERIRDFEDAFEMSIGELDQEFVKYMRRVR